MKKSLQLLAAFALSLSLAWNLGCASNSGNTKNNSNTASAEENDWWNNPGDLNLKGYLSCAVGASSLSEAGSVDDARSFAENSAAEKLAAQFGARIRALIETWSKSAGNRKVKASISQYFNNERAIQKFVNKTLKGLKPLKYKQVGDTIYVLMGLQISKALEAAYNDISENGIADQTLWKTEAMKRDFMGKMEKLAKEQEQKAKNLWEKKGNKIVKVK
ncbi:MAG: hypothetical protein D6805_03775 [Planctomycetota bacterium]|nr:MAG: hypothetical protein D6805_03775 [Planctomycetota bacterium]